MSLYKFKPNDIFLNRVETTPANSFLIYNGVVYYNNEQARTGNHANNLNHVPSGYVSLYETNVDRASDQLIQPFLIKDSTRIAFKTISVSDFNSNNNFGGTMTGAYPLSSSISKDYYSTNAARSRIDALRNTMNFYTAMSPHYAYEGNKGNKSTQEIGLISIPSIFFGDSIEKGSVDLKFYITGTLVGRLIDKERNGELYEVTGSNVGAIAGVVLYNEGFLILSGNWDISGGDHTENYTGAGASIPNWAKFGASMSGSILVPNSTFTIDFNGLHRIPTLTMLAHAPKGELNHSNNPTFISKGQNINPETSSYAYRENPKLTIKNTISSSFYEHTGSFKKQTFISEVGIYDENKNLIAIAKLAKPVRKLETEDYTFKFRIDF